MREYRISSASQIYVISLSLIITLLAIFTLFVWDKTASLFHRILAVLTVIICIGGSYGLTKIKIVIDDGKIELFTVDTIPIFWGQGIKQVNLSLYWNEIAELHTNYFIFAETPNVILKPKGESNKKRIEFIMAGMPLDLLRDILAHLPPDAKVNLYPYLKRKLEDKQTWFYVK